MATATPTAYSAAAGAKVRGGRAVPFPAWRVGRPLNEWHPIQGTVNSGSAAPSNIGEYSGMVKVGTRFVFPLSGGHHVANNNTVEIDFANDSPFWNMVEPGSSQANIVAVQTGMQPYYLDGKPVGRHTRFNGQLINGSIFMLGCRDQYSEPQSPGSFPSVDRLDLGTKQWDPAGTWPNVSNLPMSGNGVNGGAFLDPQGYGWVVSGWKFDHVNKTWTQPLTAVASKGVRYPYATSMRRNHVFGLCMGDGWGGGNTINSLIQVGNVQTNIDFTPNAITTRFVTNQNLEAGMGYDEVNDLYLYHSGILAGDFYVARPAASGTLWTMEDFPFGPNNEIPPTCDGGCQNKLQWSAEYGGFFLFPSANSNAYFMRTV